MKLRTRKKCAAARQSWRCSVQPLEDRRLLATIGNNIAVGDVLQNYRLAIAATAEYTAYFGGVNQAQQAIENFVDDLNDRFEEEFSIHLELVSGTNVIYTNPGSDPFTNGSPGTLLGENQATLDSVIGSDNYDIGHVFGTLGSGGSGIASVGVVGRNNWKARGSSSSSNPVGSGWLALAGHEIAHQFDASHSFNGVLGNCGSGRSAGNAYEPGSGTTLMSYAGSCGSDNIQVQEDDYFHAASFEQVQEYINSFSFAGPHSVTPTGNSIPTVSGGANYTIPARSFFELNATGSDADTNQTLRYNWEQLDLGPAQSLGSPDNGSSPLFRSYSPDTNSSRSFPQYESILNNTTPAGETLPTTNRDLNFRVTVRDGFGGVNSDDVRLTVVDTGSAFRVNSPNSAVNWMGGSNQTISWNVAGTNANGINASNVDIRLSTDGGQTFPLLLATTANDGSHSLTLPNIDASQARVRIEATNNVFFDVSDANFTITANNNQPGVSFTETGGQTLVEEGGAYDTYQIGLNTNPSGSVSIEIAADADTEISLDGINFATTGVVTLTSTVPRTVTVRAVEDTLDEGPEMAALVHTIIASNDSSYPTSLPLNPLPVTVIDDESPPVIGLDFDCCGSTAPPNWNQSLFFTDQTNMIRDDGQATGIDLDLTAFGSFNASTVGPVSSTIPQHNPSLAALDGFAANTGQVRATYTGLTPGASYGVYVIGFENRPGTYVQNVSIAGGTTLPSFTQNLIEGSLHVNDELGDNDRKLVSFEHTVTANSNGRIVITVSPGSGSSGVSLAGLAIREVPVAPPVAAAAVVARQLFYNNSAFDGNDSAIDPSDDNAIAADKQALLPGNNATFANYTSYVRGINGVMIDIAGLAAPSAVDATDFTFRRGRTDTPSNWPTAPAPTNVSVREGAGENGSDRIELIWNDEALVDTWLQITATAGGDLGLATDDVFYFGNAVGETGNSSSNAYVNASDFSGVRSNPQNFLDPAAVDDVFDLDRNQRVDALDLDIVRNHATSASTALPLISPPASGNLWQSAKPQPAALELAAPEQEEPAEKEPVQELAGHEPAALIQQEQQPHRIDIRGLLSELREHRREIREQANDRWAELGAWRSLLVESLWWHRVIERG